MDVSIVLPVYNEKDNLRPLLDEVEQAMRAHTFEVIAVDDGSRDGSGQLLRELTEQKPYLRVVFLRHNYGQAAALDAGLRHASGGIVITLDADRQNDPADIPRMIAMLDQGYDFVHGWRRSRRDSSLRTVPSRLANCLIRRVTRTKMHDLGCALKAFRKEIADELRLYGEMHRYIAVLVESMGARCIEFEANHRPRVAGASKYGLGRTFKVLLDLVTVWFMRGYQTKPIYVFGGSGLLLLMLSFLIAGFVMYEKIRHGVYVAENGKFLVALLFAVVGIQLIGMGLLAEIMIRIYFESQKKDSYLIAGTAGFHRAAENAAANARPEIQSQLVS